MFIDAKDTEELAKKIDAAAANDWKVDGFYTTDIIAGTRYFFQRMIRS